MAPGFSDRIDKVLDRRLYERGKVIYNQGDESGGAFIVLKGRVDMFRKAPDGKQVLVDKAKDGQMFGELALLQDRKRAVTAVANDRTELLLVPYSFLDKKLQKVDPFVKYWIEYLVAQVTDLRIRLDRPRSD